MMPRPVRKLGWVALGLTALGITGWATLPHSNHSQAAISACSDVHQIVSALQLNRTPPPGLMSDLVQSAPKVTDAGLVGAFRGFEVPPTGDSGLRTLLDADASCSYQGL